MEINHGKEIKKVVFIKMNHTKDCYPNPGNAKLILSVIIPCYNAGTYLAKAIYSVRNQKTSFPLITEIIVIDDGSTDHSVEQLKRSDLKLLHQSHQGAAAARNYGMREAKGEYLLFLDADDVLMPGAIELLYLGLLQNEGSAVAFGMAEEFISEELDEKQTRGLAVKGNPFFGSLAGCFGKRETLLEVGFFDTRLKSGEVVDWMLRLRKSGLKVLQLAEVTVRRRIHLTNTGRVREQEQMKNYATIIRRQLQEKRSGTKQGNDRPPLKSITTSDNRVTFINWWSCDPNICNCNKDWLYLFIKNNTDIKHMNVFSVFGDKNCVSKYASKKDIFFSGENLDEKFGLYSEYADYCLDYVGLSMGFAQRNELNYLRFPLWLLYVFEPILDKDTIAKRVDYINHVRNSGKYECSIIARHDKWHIRTPIYEALKDRINILSAGRWKNNTDILWEKYNNNKIVFLNNCKFTICPENFDTPYYVTEKLFQAFLGGSIPIYAGAGLNPEPGIVNRDAVLLWEMGNKENNDAVIQKVCELNNNEKLYEEFLSQVKLLPGTVDYVYDKFSSLKEKLMSLAYDMPVDNGERGELYCDGKP